MKIKFRLRLSGLVLAFALVLAAGFAPIGCGSSNSVGGNQENGNGQNPSGNTGPSLWALDQHPRLWITPDSLPTFKSWAVPTNPVYLQLKKKADEMTAEVVQGDVPGTCVDNNNDGTPDKPWDAGTELFDSDHRITEMYAQLFAFMSLIESDPAKKTEYENRAHSLIMPIFNQAKLGIFREKEDCLDLGLQLNSCACREKRRFRPVLPYNSPYIRSFTLKDRGFLFDSIPTTVDWIYHTFTSEEKQTIREAYLIWIKENLYAETTGVNDHPSPVNTLNDPVLLDLDNQNSGYRGKLSALRFSLNNHYLEHLRTVTYMALSLDSVDDNGPKDELGHGVRDYLENAMGAWLYVTDFARRNDAAGGLSPEGWEYAELGLRFEVMSRLALLTSGEADPEKYGPQVEFYDHPFWDNALEGYLHNLPPVPVPKGKGGNLDYQTPYYEPAWYGDGELAYQANWTSYLAFVGLYDWYSGKTDRLEPIRWSILETFPGGKAQFLNRLNSSLANLAVRSAILTFMIFDPSVSDPQDPRPNLPTEFYAAGLGRILARTGWDENARFFTFKNSWNRIDHQHGDANMFEFFRKGEWLTKKWVGYGPSSGLSERNNTLALRNFCGSNGFYGGSQPSLQDFLQGSQWAYGGGSQEAYNAYDPADWQNNPMDPKVLAVSAEPDADFVYATGDSTILYNRWHPYEDDETCEDILHASRSIVWLKPDFIIIYDRALSGHNGFKRFWLNLPTDPTINGSQAVMTSPSGTQQLVLNTLLPVANNVALSSDSSHPITPGTNQDETADSQPMHYRLKVEALGDPKQVRFLNVLQGVDKNAQAATPTLIQSKSGTPFAGASLNDSVVLFKVDLDSPFNGMTYAVPGNITRHLVTGLTPNTNYQISVQNVGGMKEVEITEGGSMQTDTGGALEFTL